MNSFLQTTAIGYATRGPSDDAASSGYLISRVPLAVRWDTVTSVSAIENPALCFDNETVTEAVSQVNTKHGSYHVCCAYADLLKQWQEWESKQSLFPIHKNN